MNDRVRHAMVSIENTVNDLCARCKVGTLTAMATIVARLHVLSEVRALG